LKFVDVKTIKSIVAMIPHSPVIRGQEARNRFFLVEKLGFDVALIAGAEKDLLGDGDTVLRPLSYLGAARPLMLPLSRLLP
jgi:hypothetical protein